MAQRALSRPQERFVPQQESYRNLPKPDPEAKPTQAPKLASGDSGSEAKNMAEALAVSNKAIADFLRMEKSYEETNRMASEVRGRMGLPPVDGKGIFNYGSDDGYMMGRGKADAVDIVGRLAAELETQQYGVSSPDMTHEQVSTAVQQKIQQGFAEILSKANGNPAYLEGAAADLAKFKVAAVVEATARLDMLKDQQRIDDGVANAVSFYKTADVSGMSHDMFVEQARVKSMELMKTHGLDRTSANAIMVEAGVSHYEDMYNRAKDAEVADPEAMANAISGTSRILKLMNSKDNSGVIFGGFKRNKDGTASRNLKAEYSELKSVYGNMVSDYSKVTKDSTEFLKNSKMADVFKQLYTGGSQKEVTDRILSDPWLSRNPAELNEVLKHAATLSDSEAVIPGSKQLAAHIAMTGEGFNPSAIESKRAAGMLTGQDALALNAAWYSRQTFNMRAASFNMYREQRSQRDSMEKTSDDLARGLLEKLSTKGLSISEAKTYAKLFSNDPGKAEELSEAYLEVKSSRAAQAKKPKIYDDIAIAMSELQLPKTIEDKITTRYSGATEEQKAAFMQLYGSIDWRVREMRTASPETKAKENAVLSLALLKELGASEEDLEPLGRFINGTK